MSEDLKRSKRLIKLHLHDAAKGASSGWYEAIWAEMTDDDVRARLLNQPVVFRSLQWGDLVEVHRRRNGQLYARVEL